MHQVIPFVSADMIFFVLFIVCISSQSHIQSLILQTFIIYKNTDPISKKHRINTVAKRF